MTNHSPCVCNTRLQNGISLTSLPTGIPLPRPAVSPSTFAINALSVKYSFSTTPLSMVFISGIPEPEGKYQSGEEKEITKQSIPLGEKKRRNESRKINVKRLSTELKMIIDLCHFFFNDSKLEIY